MIFRKKAIHRFHSVPNSRTIGALACRATEGIQMYMDEGEGQLVQANSRKYRV